eukprot:3932382-Rhodomonas_salina.1
MGDIFGTLTMVYWNNVRVQIPVTESRATGITWQTNCLIKEDSRPQFGKICTFRVEHATVR